MEHTVIIQQGQTLADIAIQEYGTIEALMPIALINSLPADATPAPDTTIRLPDINPAPATAERVKAQAIQPATAPMGDDYRVFALQFAPQFA
ncbi:MAG: hypothetical protein IJZ01_02440 [Paraprevotella sp.]|nr:hypothetical protein [Paraprevotella sp.]